VLDLLREGLDGLWAHRSRTFLSTLGIVFGVAAVIAMMAIGEGAKREAEALIDQLGILNIQVKAKDFEDDPQRWEEVARKSQGLSRRDVTALREELPHATDVGGMRILKVREVVPKPADLEHVRVIGAEPSYLAALRLVRVEGRALTERDEQKAAAVCLLGTGARRELFGTDPVVGQRIRVDDALLVVVGVMSEAIGRKDVQVQGLTLDDRNKDIVIPLSTALRRFPVENDKPELSEVLVALASRDDVTGHARLAERVLSRRHRQQTDYDLTVPLALLEQHAAQQRLFNLIMGLIAGISLLVGGIGIMNITLAGVLERTREIGIRMAVGASPRDVQALFLAESSLVCLTGGILGIAVGFAISFAVAAFTGWSTAVNGWAVVLAVVVSVAEGLLFGALPARRAAMLPPAEVVRG